jgi:hypothetical protein
MGGVWFENPGTRGAEWKVHHIDQQRVHDVLAADLTGNGRPDAVSRAQSAFGRAEGRTGNVIHLYYQEELNTWRKETLECPHGEGITIADLDDDGKLDIVIGGEWFRNAAGKWIRHVFAAEWAHPHTKVEVGDINGYGRPDIVLTPAELLGQRYRISWFESPAGDKTRPWKEHAIVPDIECVVHALALGDYNKDGTVDVAYAEMHQGKDPDEVVIMFNYENGARWENLLIDNLGSHDIVAADLDGDGDLDLVGANHAGAHPLVVWENPLILRPSASPLQP